MRLSTKLREIKLMRYITKINTDSFFIAINLSINCIQEGSTKYNGTKIILWRSKNKKISRILDLTTQDFNISNNPKWCNSISICKLNGDINIFNLNRCNIIYDFLIKGKWNSTHTSTNIT